MFKPRNTEHIEPVTNGDVLKSFCKLIVTVGVSFFGFGFLNYFIFNWFKGSSGKSSINWDNSSALIKNEETKVMFIDRAKNDFSAINPFSASKVFSNKNPEQHSLSSRWTNKFNNSFEEAKILPKLNIIPNHERYEASESLSELPTTLPKFTCNSGDVVSELIKAEEIDYIRNIKSKEDGLKYLNETYGYKIHVANPDSRYYMEISGATSLMLAIELRKESVVNTMLEKIHDLNLDINDFAPEFLLRLSALMNQPAILKKLIDHGIQFNQQVSDLLHVASGSGYVEILQLLLPKMQHRINEEDEHQCTPLFVTFYGKADQIVVNKCAKLLLEAHANPNLWCGQNLQSALHYAALENNVEGIRLLIEYGARLNIADAEGNTPLTIACEAGQLEAVMTLIDAGASINLPVDFPPIFGAISTSNIEVAEVLKEFGANTNIEVVGNILWHVAASAGMDAVKFVHTLGIGILHKNDEGYLPSQWAQLTTASREVVLFLQTAEQKERQKIQKLLEAAREFNVKEIENQLDGMKGLWQEINVLIAAEKEEADDFWLFDRLVIDLIALGDHHDVAKFFCQKGLTKYHKDADLLKLSEAIQELENDDITPYLAYSLLFEKYDTPYPTDVSAKENIGTALLNKNIRLIKSIMRMDSNFINRNLHLTVPTTNEIIESTPLQYAVVLNDRRLLKIFMRLGQTLPTDENIFKASMIAARQNNLYPFLIELYKYFGYKIMPAIMQTNDLELFNRTLSCMQPSEILAEVLFSDDSIVFSDKNICKGTLLHVAAKIGNFKMCRKFVELGIKVDELSNHGLTALMVAAKYGNYESFKVLLEVGANPLLQFRDKIITERCNLFNIAIRGGNVEIIKYIVENFAGKINFHDISVKNKNIPEDIVGKGFIFPKTSKYLSSLPYYKKYDLETLWWYKAIVKKDIATIEAALQTEKEFFNFAHFIEALDLQLILPEARFVWTDQLTPLEVATMYGNVDIVKLLFRYQPYNIYNFDSKLLLYIAVRNNDPEVLSTLLKNGVKPISLKVFLNGGTIIYKLDLLYRAIQQNSYAMCKLLLPYFNETELETIYYGKTFLEWAQGVSDKRITNLIETETTKTEESSSCINALPWIVSAGAASGFAVRWLINKWLSFRDRAKMEKREKRLIAQLSQLSELLTKNEWQADIDLEKHIITSELEIKQFDGDWFVKKFNITLNELKEKAFNHLNLKLIDEMFIAYTRMFGPNSVKKHDSKLAITCTQNINLENLENEFKNIIENFQDTIVAKVKQITKQIEEQIRQNFHEYQTKQRSQLISRCDSTIENLQQRIPIFDDKLEKLAQMDKELFQELGETKNKLKIKAARYNKPEFSQFHSTLKASACRLQNKLGRLNSLLQTIDEKDLLLKRGYSISGRPIYKKNIQELSNDELSQHLAELNNRDLKLKKLEQTQQELEENLGNAKQCLTEVFANYKKVIQDVEEFEVLKNKHENKKPTKKKEEKKNNEKRVSKKPTEEKKNKKNNKRIKQQPVNNCNISKSNNDIVTSADYRLWKQHSPPPPPSLEQFILQAEKPIQPDKRLLYVRDMLDFIREALDKLKQLSDSSSSNKKPIIFETVSAMECEVFSNLFGYKMNAKVVCKHIFHFALLTSIMRMTHALAQVFTQYKLNRTENEIKELYIIRHNIMHAFGFAKFAETIKLAKELNARYFELIKELKDGKNVNNNNSNNYQSFANEYIFGMQEQRENITNIKNYCCRNIYQLCSMFSLLKGVADQLGSKFDLHISDVNRSFFMYSQSSLLHLAMYAVVFGVGECFNFLQQKDNSSYTSLFNQVKGGPLDYVITIFKQQRGTLGHEFPGDYDDNHSEEDEDSFYYLDEPISPGSLLNCAKNGILLQEVLRKINWWWQTETDEQSQDDNYLFMEPRLATETEDLPVISNIKL